jgi:hypothetical protein
VLPSHDGLAKAIQALFLHVSPQAIVLIELLLCKKGQNQGAQSDHSRRSI